MNCRQDARSPGMKELLWAIIAVALLLTLTLIVLGLRWLPANKTSLGVGNLFEDGLLFGLFALLFAPFYLAWMGVRSIWVRVRPPVPLPTDSDDPVWSRKLNRQVVETAFLAVQQARLNHNPNLAKRYISQDLYQRLRRECAGTKVSDEIRSKAVVHLKDIAFADERIEKRHCYFNATVRGIIVTRPPEQEPPAAASGTAEDFAEHLEFARALPEVKDARWQLMTMSKLET